VGRGAGEHDPAIGDDHGLVGDRQGLVHVMGDDDAGQAKAVVEALDQAHDHPAGDRVQAGQRLVVDHQRRVQGQRAGQGHAPGHAAGKLARPGLACGQQADRIELEVDDAADQRRRQFRMRAQGQGHVLGHAQVGQQAVALQQHADTLAHFQQVAAAARHRLAEHFHAACRGRQFAGQRRQQGRLAAARRTQHRGDAAARHRQVDVAQDRTPAAVEAELGEAHGG
jgi:hypothetical protein